MSQLGLEDNNGSTEIWKRKFVDNCEAIRNDGKQYGQRFAQNRITKAEYDQMRDFIRAENESGWETDYEEAIEGDKATLEVKMGLVVKKSNTYGPPLPTKRGRARAAFDNNGIGTTECRYAWLTENVSVGQSEPSERRELIKHDRGCADAWAAQMLDHKFNGNAVTRRDAEGVYNGMIRDIRANTGWSYRSLRKGVRRDNAVELVTIQRPSRAR